MKTEAIAKRMVVLREYGSTLEGATVYFRKDWGVFYFEVYGKMFGMLSEEENKQAIITIKNRPEKNEELREMYPDVVIPGYHMNKNHWNSVYIANELLSEEEIKQMIHTSYSLVVEKLPKKARR